VIAALILLAAPPRFAGDPDAALRLENPLRAAMAGTEAFGPWPAGNWEVRLHADAASFEKATGAPPGRAAQWIGDVLHLCPWEQLKRRDVDAILRHELVHRRLRVAALRRWEEEARCLYAEACTAPPRTWPAPPGATLQDRLDAALAAGTTASQTWAYRALRAWIAGRSLPPPPHPAFPPREPWHKEALSLGRPEVTVRWPAERLPVDLTVNGRPLRPGAVHVFRNGAVFGAGAPITRLPGRVVVKPAGAGWSVAWTTDARTWAAAATAGEMGDETPLEARRALAAVLEAWLAAHPKGHHPDGSLCPLTHCAVVRGEASASTLAAAATAPVAGPACVWFCASKGGVSLSPRQVWGQGPCIAPPVQAAQGDPWGTWTRTLSAREVRLLKRSVPPGLRPGQEGLFLGASGPYPVEELRLAAGRAFGWNRWPSNACRGESLPDGSLRLEGHGWGHNVGLCLATARAQAAQGLKAEQILEAAFGPWP